MVRGREAVKKAKSRCNFCQKRDARPLQQIMSELPEDRLQVPIPPFTKISVDCFGPFNVTISRNKSEKQWGLIFACLNTRAVHLEVLRGMGEGEFLGAFRIFENLRGRPCSIYSDNGTNFVAAAKTLKNQIGLTWTFQPPGAPHWGGVHEALIKSVKRAIGAVLERESKVLRHLRPEEFRLMLAEITGFLNSRPLTYESNSLDDCAALTPNHFLLQRPNKIIPNGNFASVNPRKHFRYVEGLIDEMWKRWMTEYLPNLISRPKWRIEKDNLAVGDKVLIIDTQTSRGDWLCGEVCEIHPGVDKRVRAVTVSTEKGKSIRPITKLCLLEKKANKEEQKQTLALNEQRGENGMAKFGNPEEHPTNSCEQ